MVAGLMHISASIWMLLRGGGIVFVALMKQFALGDRLTPCGSQTLPGHFRDTLPGHFLGDRLTPAMWWGVGFIALAVTMVGLSPMLAEAPRRLPPAPPPAPRPHLTCISTASRRHLRRRGEMRHVPDTSPTPSPDTSPTRPR